MANGSRLPLRRRLKIALVSLMAFFISSACSLKPPRETPVPICYAEVPPVTDTPEPIVMCYTMPAPTATPTPLCYTPTPYPTTFVSPLSPIPTPTPEARRLLQERLLAEGRFPQSIAHELGS
jgi:hypothetical protein